MKTNQSQKTTRWRRTVLALACVAAMGISTVGATVSEQYDVIPQGAESSFDGATYANSVKAPAFMALPIENRPHWQSSRELHRSQVLSLR